MITHLIITKYKGIWAWAGFLSMAVFVLPLALSGRFSFYKLLGCGKGGSFSFWPDLSLWGVLVVPVDQSPDRQSYPLITSGFISAWYRLFQCSITHYGLKAIEGHGTWDGKHPFGQLPRQSDYEGKIAVLTRATIRISKLSAFWGHVEKAATNLERQPGYLTSIGVGEVPWIKQATFSIWSSKADMKAYAYRHMQHQDVIRKTKKENWYREEMFVRFQVLQQP